jgi:hypothetical protein
MSRRDLTIFASKDGKVDEIPFNNAKSQETYNRNIQSSIKPLSCQVDINEDDFDEIFGDSFDDYENSLHKLEFGFVSWLLWRQCFLVIGPSMLL